MAEVGCNFSWSTGGNLELFSWQGQWGRASWHPHLQMATLRDPRSRRLCWEWLPQLWEPKLPDGRVKTREIMMHPGSGILSGDPNTLLWVAVTCSRGVICCKCHGKMHVSQGSSCTNTGSRIQSKDLTGTKVLTYSVFREWCTEWEENISDALRFSSLQWQQQQLHCVNLMQWQSLLVVARLLEENCLLSND